MRTELKELTTYVRRLGDRSSWWGWRLLRTLDSRVFAPPHTFQSVLALVAAQLSLFDDSAPRPDHPRAVEEKS